MRIELRDNNGYSHTIDSTNTELIGMWLADWVEKIGSDVHYPRWMIQVYPANETEIAYLKELNTLPYRDFVNSKRMWALSKAFADAATLMEKTEKRNNA